MVGLWIAGTLLAMALVLLAVGQVRKVATSQQVVRPSAVGDAGVSSVPVEPTPSDVPTVESSIGSVSETTLNPPDTGPTSTTGADTAPPESTAPTTESYVLVGGTAAITYSASSVKVAWATPLPGYTVVATQVSATSVVVEFSGLLNRSRLDARWDGGPRHTISNA